MKKKFENTGNSPIYVMGTMIPPNEMAMVDVPHEPQEVQDKKLPTLAELVAEELKKQMKFLIDELPSASDDALDMMATLEGAADSPRKSLLDAIAAEKLARADKALNGGKTE